MLLTFFVCLIPLIQGRGSYLSSCEKSETSTNIMDKVDFDNDRLYIYLHAPDGFAINIRHPNDKDIMMRLKADCVDGFVKISQKIGKTWTYLGKGKLTKFECDNAPFLIYINSRQREVFVRNTKIDLIGKPSKEGRSGTVEVKKGGVILIGSGNSCIEFPPPISTCKDAADWYNEHQRCYHTHNGKKGLNRNGFLECYSGPTCDSHGDFEPVQLMDGNTFSCVDKNGQMLAEPKKIRDVPDRDISSYCQNAVLKS